jgi:FKBP-type peptidyl-prolyl cis-trans isomerase FkpA
MVNKETKKQELIMKFLLPVLCLMTMVWNGCAKQACTNVRPEMEETQITTYAAANGMTVTKHSSGLFYEVLSPGTGVTPSVGSKVFITYTGKLLNGTVFDSNNNSINTGWVLRDLIEGWQIGLPLIKKGGSVRLLVPSSLGYGCNGAGSIPSNSVLYFDINLVDVQ